MLSPLWIIFLKGACVSLGIFLAFWVISVAIRNPSIIDVCWGLSFISVAYAFIISGEGWTLRNGFLFAIIAFWGLRISLFVLKRLDYGKKEDHRYERIRKQWGPYVRFNFLVFFILQAGIVLLVSLPILFIAANSSPGLSWIEIVGAMLCLAATAGESIADRQLEQFKQAPENKGKVCEEGLWRYSRHPNYFFEFLIWLAVYIFALGSPMGWAAFVSPLIMLHLILNVSGIPLAEKLSLQRRGEAYRIYQQSTSKFVPMPRRAQ